MLDVRLAREPAGVAKPVSAKGTTADIRLAGATLGRELSAPNAPAAATLDCGKLHGERLSAFVEGLVLGGYRPATASSKQRPPKRRAELTGTTDEQAIVRGVRLAAATTWARDLANTPASTMTPAWLATRAARELAKVGVDVEVRDARWLAEQGFGGVLAVGGGSVSPPRLIHASWRPSRPKPGVHVVIVGKGITFDTGGLNLKPGASMKTMHTDMAGGAAAIAALRTVAEARLGVRVSVLVPCAENSFSGGSFRPGDVVRHVGGRTTEVGNTDAEGRLVLADALAYAVQRLRPTVLVDIATLTGAMKVALGMRTAGLFATKDALAASLLAAGTASGEQLWRLPLHRDYAATLSSIIADANNAPGNPGGITAALFLQPFTGGVPWAHLDVAGPARANKDQRELSRGATGFGARLLVRWIESMAS